ncbi:MAG: alpha/beta hydrolase [Planctomycetota bacterium]|nr:MAG: alpha/beta hydrolase [Planctomycetota bacterium]
MSNRGIDRNEVGSDVSEPPVTVETADAARMGGGERVSAASRRSRRLWRRLMTAIAWSLVAYTGACVMLGFLQRRLIYLPTRVAALPASESGWPRALIADVACRTDDGLTLHGWYVRSPRNDTGGNAGRAGESPAGPKREAVAAGGEKDRRVVDWARSAPWVVLFFHGNGGHRGCRLPEAELFTRHGADVVLTDYRGYAENPGSPTETGLRLDARAWWRWLTTDCGVVPRRVIVYGASLGGAVATRLAGELCDRGTPPAALILRSTFSSLVDVAAYHYPWLPVRALLAERYDSHNWIGRVTCPILVIHGDADRIVPIRFGRRLFEAAPETSHDGVPKKFVQIAGGGHNDLVVLHGETLSRAVAGLLETLRRVGEPRATGRSAAPQRS